MSNNELRYLTIEEVISLPQFRDTAICPDGKKVAYVKQTSDWDGNSYPQHVWVYDRQKETHYPVTAGNIESMHPRWSPNSQQLAYLSFVGEGDKKRKQIFLHSSDQVDRIQVTYSENNVDSFKWSPDGKGIFYITQRGESEKQKKRKEMYGEFSYIDEDFEYNMLYYLEVGNSQNRMWNHYPKDLREKNDEKAIALISDLDVHIQGFDVSPDGKRVVFIGTPTPRIIDHLEQTLYMLDVETKGITTLDVSPLLAGNVLFSPDGSKICYTRFLEEKAFFNNMILETYHLERKETTRLAKQIDENIFPIVWTNRGILISWQAKTNILAGLVSEEDELLYLVDEEDMVATSPAITTDGDVFVCVKATSEQAAEVYVNDQKITDQYKLYEGKLKSKKEVISWKTKDGLEIEGVLSLPVDYDPSKSYPLIVAVHGGPTGTSFATPTTHKYQPIESFVEKGFLVLEPNYRGSAGYGETFRKANIRKLGLGDYEDVISGVDYLIETRGVDPEKVGILGWSQGGYISAFCATYSNRFKAISVGAGISNWMTYYVNTDITHFTRFYLGSDPWKDEAIYRETSPMTYINNATTPTLIQHGEVDPRVPVPNAYELYRGLKDVGVDTKLVIYKGMQHGSTKPGLNRAILKQNLDWFSHYILGEPLDEERVY
ncbi:S9 family peptidase [Margalitia sp. FSL K6-0131]|uniref:S9 family peptidase n=1 Tax=Margalitia sp. FSL K6-0131 TaxID=2954604 RepID=UPI0030FB61D2